MDLGLTDARVLVSGGSYGIGREIEESSFDAPRQPGAVVLRVENLSLPPPRAGLPDG